MVSTFLGPVYVRELSHRSLWITLETGAETTFQGKLKAEQDLAHQYCSRATPHNPDLMTSSSDSSETVDEAQCKPTALTRITRHVYNQAGSCLDRSCWISAKSDSLCTAHHCSALTNVELSAGKMHS